MAKMVDPRKASDLTLVSSKSSLNALPMRSVPLSDGFILVIVTDDTTKSLTRKVRFLARQRCPTLSMILALTRR